MDMNKREAFVFFLLSSIIIYLFARAFNAPLYSPDSLLYREMSLSPWQHVGGWHPIGFPILVFAVKYLGGSDLTALIIYGSALNFIVFYILRQFFSKRESVFGSLFLLAPNFLMLELTFWSEVSMTLCFLILVTLFFLDAGFRGRRESPPLRYRLGLIILIFIVLAELMLTRKAAVFLLPAASFLGVLILWDWSPKQWRSLCGICIFVFGILYGIGVMNFFGGRDRAMVCQQAVVAMAPLEFCSPESSVRLCQFDPNKSWFGVSRSGDYQTMSEMHFSPQSPIELFKARYGPNELCQEVKSIWKHQARDNYKAVVKMLGRRLLNQFGPWQMSERANPLPELEVPTFSLSLLDSALETHKQILNFLPLGIFLFLVVFMRRFFRRRLTRKDLLAGILYLAAMGHAFGLCINNPFLALRYVAIHQLLLLLGLVILLAKDPLRNGTVEKK